MTGFVHEHTTAGTDVLGLSAFAILDQSKKDASPSAIEIVTPLQITSSSTEYIYQASASDTIVGPTLLFDQNVATANNLVKRIQLSLVFIGLKSFSATTYPTGTADSFIVAVGGFGYSGVVAAAADSLGTGYASVVDGLQITTVPSAKALNFKFYNGNTATTFGHSFCGVTGIMNQ